MRPVPNLPRALPRAALPIAPRRPAAWLPPLALALGAAGLGLARPGAARADDAAAPMVPAPRPACIDIDAEPAGAGAGAGTAAAGASQPAPHGAPLSSLAGAKPSGGGAEGGPSAAGALAQGYPFAGQVLGQEVNLRAGPSTSYEVVARLAGDERVTVLAETYGWYAVQCAREVSVYVHKDLLEERAQGLGVIARDRVNLRAAAAAEASVLGQAARGDLVRVLGRQGDWVALAAPPQATFYVHRDFVRRVGAAATSDPVVEAATAAAHAATAAGAATPGAAARVPDATDLLIEARDLYLRELDKADMATMDFAAALARYEEAARRADRPDVRAAAEGGIRQVRLAERLKADYEERMRRLSAAKAPAGR